MICPYLHRTFWTTPMLTSGHDFFMLLPSCTQWCWNAGSMEHLDGMFLMSSTKQIFRHQSSSSRIIWMTWTPKRWMKSNILNVDMFGSYHSFLIEVQYLHHILLGCVMGDNLLHVGGDTVWWPCDRGLWQAPSINIPPCVVQWASSHIRFQVNGISMTNSLENTVKDIPLYLYNSILIHQPSWTKTASYRVDREVL